MVYSQLADREADATPALVRAEVHVGSLDPIPPCVSGKNIMFAIVGCNGKLVFHQNKLTGLLTGSTATDCEEYDFCSSDGRATQGHLEAPGKLIFTKGIHGIRVPGFNFRPPGDSDASRDSAVALSVGGG